MSNDKVEVQHLGVEYSVWGSVEVLSGSIQRTCEMCSSEYQSVGELEFVVKEITNANEQISLKKSNPAFEAISKLAVEKYQLEIEEVIEREDFSFLCDICVSIEEDVSCENDNDLATEYHPSTDEQ